MEPGRRMALYFLRLMVFFSQYSQHHSQTKKVWIEWLGPFDLPELGCEVLDWTRNRVAETANRE